MNSVAKKFSFSLYDIDAKLQGCFRPPIDFADLLSFFP